MKERGKQIKGRRSEQREDISANFQARKIRNNRSHVENKACRYPIFHRAREAQFPPVKSCLPFEAFKLRENVTQNQGIATNIQPKVILSFSFHLPSYPSGAVRLREYRRRCARNSPRQFRATTHPPARGISFFNRIFETLGPPGISLTSRSREYQTPSREKIERYSRFLTADLPD